MLPGSCNACFLICIKMISDGSVSINDLRREVWKTSSLDPSIYNSNPWFKQKAWKKFQPTPWSGTNSFRTGACVIFYEPGRIIESTSAWAHGVPNLDSTSEVRPYSDTYNFRASSIKGSWLMASASNMSCLNLFRKYQRWSTVMCKDQEMMFYRCPITLSGISCPFAVVCKRQVAITFVCWRKVVHWFHEHFQWKVVCVTCSYPGGSYSFFGFFFIVDFTVAGNEVSFMKQQWFISRGLKPLRGNYCFHQGYDSFELLVYYRKSQTHRPSRQAPRYRLRIFYLAPSFDPGNTWQSFAAMCDINDNTDAAMQYISGSYILLSSSFGTIHIVSCAVWRLPCASEHQELDCLPSKLIPSLLTLASKSFALTCALGHHGTKGG